MICELAYRDLTPGKLAALFAAGNAAVLVHCSETLGELWAALLENVDEQLPWEAPLVDIARNYHGCGDITASLGDLFYFQPGQHGYIARKIALEKDKERSGAVAEPREFVQGDERYHSPQSVFDQCWDMGERLMMALAPDGQAPADYQVSVQRIKYQETVLDLANVTALARNSLGRWGRFGHVVDERRMEAAGPLRPKWVSDLYGFITQIPILRAFATVANKAFTRQDSRSSLSAGQSIIEGAHYDYRYFTALCGRRRNTITQIFVDGAWVELPVNLTTLAIFPGTIASHKFGIPHVLHRVLHVATEGAVPDDRNDRRTQNVTLLIGAA